MNTGACSNHVELTLVVAVHHTVFQSKSLLSETAGLLFKTEYVDMYVHVGNFEMASET